MGRLAEAGFEGFKVSAVVTRLNAGELGDLLALASSLRCPAPPRPPASRPAGAPTRGTSCARPLNSSWTCTGSWWIIREVLTGDSFFHLGALGEPIAGLNLCGAGRVVCLVDPVGDVYACPFVMHPEFRAGSVREPGGFAGRLARLDAVQRICASRQSAAPAPRAGRSTPATEVAWRRSSSPVFPSTARTPNACWGTARERWRWSAQARRRAPAPAIPSQPPARRRACGSPGRPRRQAAVTRLVEPVRLGRREARNRLVFGPHETNLAKRRALSDRHVAYYRARAAGGAGVIVVEEASVRRLRLAVRAGAARRRTAAEGWSRISRRLPGRGCARDRRPRPRRRAGLERLSPALPARALRGARRGDAGSPQGDGGRGRREPGRAPSHGAAAAAVAAGCDGVELNAGQYSLLRQFCSGLTNLRSDELGV